MSDAVLKEDLTAWQRWELPAFDAQATSDAHARLPTAAEIESIHQQAHEEGFQAGYAEGAKKARDEEAAAREARQRAHDAEQMSSEAAQKSQDETHRLAAMMDALNAELHKVDEEVAQELLNLALEISKQMVRQALAVNPDLVLDVVRQAVGELPQFNQHAHLVLHPEDAALVRSKMGEQFDHTGWKIIEDAQIERGGCRVETAHSQIDATLSARWKRVVESMGQDNTWLTP